MTGLWLVSQENKDNLRLHFPHINWIARATTTYIPMRRKRTRTRMKKNKRRSRISGRIVNRRERGVEGGREREGEGGRGMER